MIKSKVFFSKDITPENVVEIYEQLGFSLPGKVAVKVHSGEAGNQNYLHPEFMRPIVEHVKGTIVECNTAYEGARNSTEKHKKLIKDHGWAKYFDVDIMDAEGEDMVLDIPNGKVIKENFVGNHLANYDSMLVISHFKGHPMGGYGGALKQLSIGISSSAGKTWIHSAGKIKDQTKLWDNLPEQDQFLEAMADGKFQQPIDTLKKQASQILPVVVFTFVVFHKKCHIIKDPAEIHIFVQHQFIGAHCSSSSLFSSHPPDGAPSIISKNFQVCRLFP